MKCLETPCMQGMIRMCGDGFRQGWHERNGGNLSYRIPQTELEVIRDQLSFDQPWQRSQRRCRGWPASSSP